MCTNDNLSTTRSIVTDYLNWRLKPETITNNRLFILVRKIGYDCETSYYSQSRGFHFLFPSFSLINLQNFHYEIAKELFSDEIITWTKIITFISFSAILAEHLIQQQENNDLIITSIIDWTTDFIDTELHTWLENENYWVNFLNRIFVFVYADFFLLGWMFENV